MSDPVPILRTISEAMRRYDEDAWDRKVRELRGLEQDEARDARERFSAPRLPGLTAALTSWPRIAFRSFAERSSS